jgi:hypothetical protein
VAVFESGGAGKLANIGEINQNIQLCIAITTEGTHHTIASNLRK